MRPVIRFVAVTAAYVPLFVGGTASSNLLPDAVSLALLVVGTAAFGAVVNRWNVAAVPIVLLAVGAAVLYGTDPHCNDCGEDSHEFTIVIGFILYVIPATVMLALGVAVRRMADTRRGRR